VIKFIEAFFLPYYGAWQDPKYPKKDAPTHLRDHTILFILPFFSLATEERMEELRDEKSGYLTPEHQLRTSQHNQPKNQSRAIHCIRHDHES